MQGVERFSGAAPAAESADGGRQFPAWARLNHAPLVDGLGDGGVALDAVDRVCGQVTPFRGWFQAERPATANEFLRPRSLVLS